MAVPGLASFLAFRNRPQTPRVPRWGKVGRQRGASWALTLPLLTPPLPLPVPAACLISLSYFTLPPQGLRPGTVSSLPRPPSPVLTTGCTLE